MTTYTVSKTIRPEFRKGTADHYAQTIGYFESRQLAEQALVALAGREEIQSATIIENDSEEK